MSTLLDLYNAAARKINIIQSGESLNPSDLATLQYSLKTMIDSWSNNRLLIYNIQEYVFPITSSQPTYTLGLGGDWNVPRPMKIEFAYARLNNGTLQQLDIQNQSLTVAQYAGISVKNTPSTFSFAIYDDNSYPLRNITLFPIPNGPMEMVLWLREPLADLSNQSIFQLGSITPGSGYTNGYYPNQNLAGGSGVGAQANITVLNNQVFEVNLIDAGSGYTVGDVLTSTLPGGTGFSIPVTFVSPGLDDPINFPPGYEDAFVYNLAVRVAPEFGKTVQPTIVETANNAVLNLERLNSVPRFMTGDGGMIGPLNGRGRYFNWITGNFWSFGNGNGS